MTIEREVQTEESRFVFFRRTVDTYTHELPPGHEEKLWSPKEINASNALADKKVRTIRVRDFDSVELTESSLIDELADRQPRMVLERTAINREKLTYRRGNQKITIRWKPTPSLRLVV